MSEGLCFVAPGYVVSLSFAVTILRPLTRGVSTVLATLDALCLHPVALLWPLLTLWFLPHPSTSITVHFHGIISVLTVSALAAKDI